MLKVKTPVRVTVTVEPDERPNGQAYYRTSSTVTIGQRTCGTAHIFHEMEMPFLEDILTESNKRLVTILKDTKFKYE